MVSRRFPVIGATQLIKSYICEILIADKLFLLMKAERAKQLLCENNCNVSQIAEISGYSFIHYFSRQFKRFTGMIPGEYSRSIKTLIQAQSKL